MNLQKKNLLITIFIIIILNILININNKQKTSFSYFIWDTQNISIGKIVNISFVSGLLVSIILNNYIVIKDLNKDIIDEEEEEKEDTIINNFKDIPPERDIRDAQPTISVNYRVVKTNENNNRKYEDDFSDESKYEDDWSEANAEW